MSSRRRTARTVAAVATLATAILLPPSAQATTVTMGDPNVPSTFTTGTGCFPCTPGETVAQSFTPDGEVNFAPGSGVIRSWRAEGQGTVQLTVVESEPEGGWAAVGTSAAAANLEGQPNPTSLPIGAGDLIGVDLGPSSPGKSVIGFDELTNAEVLRWEPQLADFERAGEEQRENRHLEFNAEVVLAPVVSSLSPASGSTTGGNAVKISGLFLDGATSVTFGSTPASSFSVDSSSQITAIAPPAAASTVDVRVTGPGGSSEVTSADKYTFTAPAASAVTTNSVPKTLIEPPPFVALAKPAVTGFSQSAARWRRGGSLPHISSAPVGTTFSFSLNEQATVTFTFTQSLPGRRAHGSCVAPSRGNAHKPSCRRTVVVGSFGTSGKTGLNKMRFQGRLSSTKALKPGSYAVSITAHDARGLKAVSRSLSFTIVP